MSKYIVSEGQVFEIGNSIREVIEEASLRLVDYGSDWVLVDAKDESEALAQAEHYDIRAHPAQTEMELFAATLTGLAQESEQKALDWAGWN